MITASSAVNPLPLAGVAYFACHFDSDRHADSDYSRLAVTPPRSRVSRGRSADYLAGRHCARKALQQLTGQDLTLNNNANGLPAWPEGITGSITHDHGMAAAIVAFTDDHLALGIDIESLFDSRSRPRLEARLCTSAEWQRIESSSMPRPELVSLVFSAKESLFKSGWLAPDPDPHACCYLWHDGQAAYFGRPGTRRSSRVHYRLIDGRVITQTTCKTD